MEMIQLTEFCHAESKLHTQYGFIPYKEWIEKEAERISKNPERTVEIRTGTDYKGYPAVALFVNRVA